MFLDFLIPHSYIEERIEKKGFESDAPQAEGGEESAVEAVSLVVEHDVERGTVAFLALVGDTVQVGLDGEGRIEAVEFPAQVFGEAGLELGDEVHDFSPIISQRPRL